MSKYLEPQQFVSTVSSKGQITIPVAARKHLEIMVQDKVVLIFEPNKTVKIMPLRYTKLSALQGAAGSLKQPLSMKKMKQIAYEDRHENSD